MGVESSFTHSLLQPHGKSSVQRADIPPAHHLKGICTWIDTLKIHNFLTEAIGVIMGRNFKIYNTEHSHILLTDTAIDGSKI